MENKLVFKDGTEILNGSASKISNEDKILVRIPGYAFMNATILLSNPDKTEEIVCYNGIHKTTYSGFTDLYSIQNFEDLNYIEGWLKGENVSYHDEITVPKIYAPLEKPYFT